MKPVRVLISGAGISGLTTALFLSRSGFEVVVFERAEQLAAIGAGLQLSPNAWKTLQQLGLEEALNALGTFPNSIRLNNGRSGKQIATVPLGKTVHETYGAPYCVMHRADLQSVLYNACKQSQQITFHFSKSCVNFSSSEDQVTLETDTNGIREQAQGNLLVIADGIHSNLREAGLGLPSPQFQNKIAWRSLIPQNEIEDENLLEDTYVWLSSKAHCVSYPVSGGQYVNFVAILPGEESDKTFTTDDRLNGSSKLFEYFPSIKQYISHDTTWTAWPLYAYRNPLCSTHPLTVLIGDAGHAMLPFAAQGAAMGIEDAAILARQLKTQSTPKLALVNFEHQRFSRVSNVMKLAKSNGRIYHLPQPLAFFRDLVMRNSSPASLLKRQDWIYNWEP